MPDITADEIRRGLEPTKELEDAGEPTDPKESLDGIGHELLMWTIRLDAVRACIYDEIDGNRSKSFDDPDKLWGAFYLLGDIRDGQSALSERIEAIESELKGASDAN